MGCYCFSGDKKFINNDQIININVYETEKNKSPITNIEIIKKNVNNDNFLNHTHKNVYNHINQSNIIICNNIKNKKITSEKKLINFHDSTKNSNFSFVDKKNSKNQITLNNDVIVSGNEINPEKIYIKKKLLGSGAFGEVWLVSHKELNKDFAMKIIKKRKNKSNDEKEI